MDGPPPGWYPDPAGSTQRRFWDGARWGAELRPGPPGEGSAHGLPPGPAPSRRRRRVAPWLLIGALVAVSAVVLALVLVHPWNRGTEITAPPPTPTLRGGDDGEPTPTPTPTPSPSPTAIPSPTDDASPQGSVPCPYIEENPPPYPADGRVHGGGLSFAAIRGWTDPSPGGLAWAADDSTQDLYVTDRWFNLAVVGALRTADGFPSGVRGAAIGASQCMISSSGWYPRPTKITLVSSRAVTVSGRPGYAIVTDVFEPPDQTGDPTILGDRVTVITVDTGTPGQVGAFVASSSLGRQEILDASDAAAASLTVG